MVRKNLIAIITGIALASYSATAIAGGYENDAKRMEQLEKTVAQQGEMLQNMHDHIMRLDGQKHQEMGATPECADAYLSKEKAGWAENIKWFGDFRYRHQIEKADGAITRNRNRIRARIGMEAKVNDDTDFIFQMASSDLDADEHINRDPVSANSTLDDYFDDKELAIDLAYIDYHPEEIFGFKLTNEFIKEINLFAGKMKNPFYRAGKNEVIFDDDLRPEGGALKITAQIPDTNIELFTNVGGFWVEERSSDSDTSLWGVQGGMTVVLLEKDENLGKVKFTTGLSYYDYGSIKETTAYDAGNNTTSGGSYLYDYDMFEVFGELESHPFDTPVALFANYVNNTDRDVEDHAWQVGVKVGKAKKPGQWEAKYLYKKLQNDSVLGIFTDSDFGGGGAGNEGHEIAVNHMFAKNFKLGATLFINQRDFDKKDSSQDGQLYLAQFDAVVTF
ncbi:putative porin [bacterium]|nr:putative porin [bacterium]